MKRAKRFLTFALALALIAAALPAAVAAADIERETVKIGQSLSHTGIETPGYTFESSLLQTKEKVGAMVFNIGIDLPPEGDVSWNDWCGEVLAVRDGGVVKYYDFGGGEVGWGVDMTGDGEADTGGKDSASWVGTAANGTCTVVVPVNATDFSIDFYDNCWDSATDIDHYTILSATAVFGEVQGTELVKIGQDVSYTGSETPGYEFLASSLTTKGNVAAVAFNISIALPSEGDVSWNDWCGQAAAVNIGGDTWYYDFGGGEVSWGADMTGDGNADTGGRDSNSWVGTAANGSMTIVVPVNAPEFTIALYDNCWDSETDIPHWTVNSATAIFGSVVAGTGPETPEPIEVPDFDPSGTYNAYLGIQASNWIFRDAWADTGLGANGKGWDSYDGNHFDSLFETEDGSTHPGTFTNTEIKGNGTYKVSLNGYDFSGSAVNGAAESFNLLFISTDIPIAGEKLTFSNVKVIIGGSTRFTFKDMDDIVIEGGDKGYYELHCINRWNSELGGEDGLFGYAFPSDGEIAIEFTVAGFDYDNESASAAASDPTITPPPATPTPAPSSDDDGLPGWVIPVIIAGAAVIIIVVVLLVMKGKKK